ncbi:hypothetical protein A2415_03470 [candidate division WWE3 bacterium RIFOXYC1_FULL_39_7]|uniref:UDP-N-acetylglucosamine kinase n=2 Tax=Katanobacteria TaxID=422282 RepID=A0A1F4X9I6_UNCKA|nr:MAG: hypothetical protein A2415_03470 [candidate division WWE3 bacterium RIFOXYC1_FULL_39_7]OGC78365.1 MAG: hypothetical protein A2619_05055 [candidate division WWE3 bacterium RIFOXYD1_FULL_39_9]
MTKYSKHKLIPHFHILVRGLPGSGKSTLANKLIEQIDLKLIDPDLLTSNNISFKMFLEAGSQDSSFRVLPSVTKKYRYNLDFALRIDSTCKNFVWTQAWSNMYGIKNTFQFLQNRTRAEQLRFIIIELEVSTETAVSRLASRTGDIPKSEETVKRFTETAEKYTLSNFDYHKIDAECSENEVYLQVVDVLSKYFLQ